MVYKKIMIHVKLPEDYSEVLIDSAIEDVLKEYDGEVIETEKYADSLYSPKDFPVFLVQDDRNEGNIGVAVYKYDRSFDLEDKAAADHYVDGNDCLTRIHGCSEMVAWANAREYCSEQGYMVVWPNGQIKEQGGAIE